MRPRRLSPVTRVVIAVDSLGAVAAVAVAAALAARTTSAPWWLVAGLLALTVAGEVSYVRLRHGGSTEDLSLFEAAVVVDVLLLPPAAAIAVPLVALAVASVIQRRPLVKAAFNLGTYAAATAALVGVYHLIADGSERFGAASVVGLCLGTLAFAAVNLTLLARVLSIIEGVPAWTVVREGARLSAFMAIGNVAVGSVAVLVAETAPFLLPFTALPAVALTYAYRAAAQEQTQRERSTLLLDLSSRLARRLDADDLLSSYLEILRAAFHADVAIAVLEDPAGGWPTVLETTADDTRARPATTSDVALLHRGGLAGATYADDALPHGWKRCLLAGLEADGNRLGVLVLGSATKELSRGDLTLLTPLASALGVALRGADHLEQLVEETSKLKAVVDHSSDGILVLDGAGKVLVWNPALTAMTGVSASAADGARLDELVKTVDTDGNPVDAGATMSALTPQSPRADVELGVVRSDGEQRWLRCAHAAIFDDTGVLTRDVVIAHDVTRERQVDRMKADFIATVSHELRTPMTPIKGYTDLLRKRGDRMTPEKRGECLDIIADRVSHLGRLVEDLLLASRITSPQSPRQHVAMRAEDLAELTRRAVADLTHSTDRVDVTVPDVAVPVACDAMRTVQVITNLVSNALKYSEPSTRIDVVVDASRPDAALLSVSDRGRGIPSDHLERVFEKFHRVEDPLRMTTSGTGLGLFIARQLATAMGGDIAVTSTLGVGSTFTLSLPHTTAPAAPIAVASAAPQMTRTA